MTLNLATVCSIRSSANMSILTCKFRMLQCEEWMWKLCILQCELHLCCPTSTVCSSNTTTTITTTTTTTTTNTTVVKGALAAAGTYACASPQKYDKKIQINQCLEGSVELIVRTLRVHFILYGVQAVIMKCNLYILLTSQFDNLHILLTT